MPTIEVSHRPQIIPQPGEAAMPTNMPSATQIEQWEKNIGRDFKLKCDPKDPRSKVTYRVVHMFPEHDLGTIKVPKSEVTFRYFVEMVFPVDKEDKAWNVDRIDRGFFHDVKSFLDAFNPD